MKEMRDVISTSGKSIRRIPIERVNRPRRSIVRSRLGAVTPIGKGGGVRGNLGDRGDRGDRGDPGAPENFHGRPGGPGPGRGASHFGLWAIALISVLILFLAVSFLFGGAKIEITPRQENVVIDGNFRAFRNASSEELDFEVMTITREVSKEVPATGEEFVQEKASGRITVFNNYSSAGQKLIKNTRFETPEGLIYRIKDAITVPGRKTIGGDITPGSIQVTVYADKPGERYNIGLTDFTIPGLKGDPRYSKSFARSNTAMTGGFSGNLRRASQADLDEARIELEGELRSQLIEEALSVKPEGFILLESSYIILTESGTSNSSLDEVLVTENGTLYGFIFDQESFAKFVAINTIATYDGGEVELIGLDDLVFSINSPSLVNPESNESLSFALSGSTKVVWGYDEGALRADLASQSKKSIENILSNYSSIDRAVVTLRPFWKRSFPADGSKIKVKRILD